MPIIRWNHNQARYHKNLLRDGRNLELSIHSKGAPTLQWRQVSQVSHSFGGKPQQIEKPCKTHSADSASSPPPINCFGHQPLQHSISVTTSTVLAILAAESRIHTSERKPKTLKH